MSQKTAQEEASDIVATSGNSFHSRVINYFRARDWQTQISPFYIDGVTDKTRETDLIAEKLFTQPSSYRREKYVRMRLFIECKYVKDTTVFWFDGQDENATRGWLNTYTPFQIGNTHTLDTHVMA